MQDRREPKVRSREAADQARIAGSPLSENWRRAAELVEALRDAGYECELLGVPDLH
jgi:hypothetical protein